MTPPSPVCVVASPGAACPGLAGRGAYAIRALPDLCSGIRIGAPRFLLGVFSFGLEAPASPRRRSRGPRLGLRCVGQALATEAIAECIRSGSVGEAESNIGLLCLVPAPATSHWDASVTVERINLYENTAKASRRKCEFDQMREVPFVRKADDLAFATSHLAQSS